MRIHFEAIVLIFMVMIVTISGQIWDSSDSPAASPSSSEAPPADLGNSPSPSEAPPADLGSSSLPSEAPAADSGNNADADAPTTGSGLAPPPPPPPPPPPESKGTIKIVINIVAPSIGALVLILIILCVKIVLVRWQRKGKENSSGPTSDVANNTFDPLSESPSTRDSRITMADFCLCSTSRSHSHTVRQAYTITLTSRMDKERR